MTAPYSNKTYDAVVIGLGGMGSSTCLALAKRGLRVLGLETHSRGHHLGSSHGYTRMIRRAYFENPKYIPLLNTAYKLWDELSDYSKQTLFHRVGLLIMGNPKNAETLSKAQAAAKQFGISLDFLPPDILKKEFFEFKTPETFSGTFEKDAGYLEVENCVLNHLKQAEELGAEIKTQENVLNWEESSGEVTVTTYSTKYKTKTLLITAGAWSAPLLKHLGMSLVVKKAPQAWFAAPKEYETLPCFAFDLGKEFIYGFPNIAGQGMKVARYQPFEEIENPSEFDRTVPDDMLNPIRLGLQFLPKASQNPIATSMCMYTLTKDEHFVIDQLPQTKNVYFATGCSGHAFKFTSVIGEILADFSENGKTDYPIDFLRISSR